MSAFDPPIHAGMSPKEYEEAMKSVREPEEGDVVTVRVRVKTTYGYSFDAMSVSAVHHHDNDYGVGAFSNNDILSIEPRPVAVGDRVEWCTEDDRYEGVVRFIDCDDPINPDALVRTDSGQAHVWPLSTLTRVESDDAE